MVGDVHLRPETPDDDAFVRGLLAEMKAAEFAPLALPAEALAQLVESQVTIYRHGHAAQFPDARHLVIATPDHGRAGYLAVVHRSDALHLTQFLVASTLHGRGIGTATLITLLGEAQSAGLPLRLSVAPWNPARRLYERMGLSVVGTSPVALAMEARA